MPYSGFNILLSDSTWHEHQQPNLARIFRTVSFVVAWVMKRGKRTAAPRDCGRGFGATTKYAVLGFQHFTFRFNLARTSTAWCGKNIQHRILRRSLGFAREERAEQAAAPREIARGSGAKHSGFRAVLPNALFFLRRTRCFF